MQILQQLGQRKKKKVMLRLKTNASSCLTCTVCCAVNNWICLIQLHASQLYNSIKSRNDAISNRANAWRSTWIIDLFLFFLFSFSSCRFVSLMHHNHIIMHDVPNVSSFMYGLLTLPMHSWISLVMSLRRFDCLFPAVSWCKPFCK